MLLLACSPSAHPERPQGGPAHEQGSSSSGDATLTAAFTSGEAVTSTQAPERSNAVRTPLPVVPTSAREEAPLVRADVEQLLTSPVTHLTAGKRRGAALGSTPHGAAMLHVFALDPKSGAGHPAVPLSIPAPLSPDAATTLGLHTGRDDWPRLIAAGGANEHSYYRFRPSPGWQSPRDEQGALAKPGLASGFYGVLGHEDPEVLCAPSAFCYEKRQTGWHKRPLPGPGLWDLRLLSNGEAWAWSNTTPTLCRLNSTWDCALPHPEARMTSLEYFNGTYLALTPEGVLAYDEQWQLRVAMPAVRAILALGKNLVVVSADGAWLWDGQLHRIHTQTAPLAGGCCVAPLGDSPQSFIIGGEHGVTRVSLHSPTFAVQ